MTAFMLQQQSCVVVKETKRDHVPKLKIFTICSCTLKNAVFSKQAQLLNFSEDETREIKLYSNVISLFGNRANSRIWVLRS